MLITADEIRRSGLKDVSEQQRTLAYLKSIWVRRDYVISVPAADLRSRHMNTALGQFWHVLNPLFTTAVYFLIFGVILRTDRGVDNFLLFLTTGVFFYQFSQRSMMNGAKAIQSNRGLIKSLQFPRAILVLTAIVEQTLAFLPMVGILLFMAIVTGAPISAGWLWLVPLIATQVLFNLGGAFVLARAADRFSDLLQVLPYLFRIMHYMAGVMFSVDRFVSNPSLRAVFDLNPFFAFVSLARLPLLGGELPPILIGTVLVWSITLPILGFFVFRGGEQDYGRE